MSHRKQCSSSQKANLEVTLNKYRGQSSTASKLYKVERQVSRGSGNINRDYDVARWLALNLQNKMLMRADLHGSGLEQLQSCPTRAACMRGLA